jgi:hypothetical protein
MEIRSLSQQKKRIPLLKAGIINGMELKNFFNINKTIFLKEDVL